MKKVLLLAAALSAVVFTGCSTNFMNYADKAYEKGQKVYSVGEKIHDGLEKAGLGAKKAEKVYLDLKSKKEHE